MIELLDVLKEVDLRIAFTHHSQSVTDRQDLDESSLQRRLRRGLYGMGTNTGLKRVSGSSQSISYQELQSVHHKYIHKAALQNATGQVANAIFATSNPAIWDRILQQGDDTITYAAALKKSPEDPESITAPL